MSNHVFVSQNFLLIKMNKKTGIYGWQARCDWSLVLHYRYDRCLWRVDNNFDFHVFSLHPHSSQLNSPKKKIHPNFDFVSSIDVFDELTITLTFMYLVWDNYTLPTYGLSLILCAYLWFKFWHFTHLWFSPLPSCNPPLQFPLL